MSKKLLISTTAIVKSMRFCRIYQQVLDYTYADKTNYLTGVTHSFAGNTQSIGYRYGNLANGEMPDQVYDITWNGQKKQDYTYDGLGRLTQKNYTTKNNKTFSTKYTYVDVLNSDKTTTLVKKVENKGMPYTYEYDAAGNITSIDSIFRKNEYVYDELNQLIKEVRPGSNEIYEYAYENGNIVERKVYSYIDNGYLRTDTWDYNDGLWKDLLTSYKGKAITYDDLGNPMSIGNRSFYWHNVNQLAQIREDSNLYEYTYNMDGQRIKKVVNGVETEFFYNGSILAGQKTGDNLLIFMYDDNGDPFGFTYNGLEFFYGKDAQNNVVAIYDSDGNRVGYYGYDAWGNVSSDGEYIEEIDDFIAEINPLRYRGYYYDSETQYYYLNSRYYSPDMCRFINADDLDILHEDQGSMIDHNLFTYCLNNPVNMIDKNGNIAILTCVLIGAALGAAAGGGCGAYISYKKYQKVKIKYVVVGTIAGGAVGAALGYGVGVAIGASGSYIAGSGGMALLKTIQKTKITNKSLSNWIKECFRSQGKIGNGGLSDAIRYELRTGKLVGGKSHVQKGIERLAGLKNIIKKGGLSSSELTLANKLLSDLEKALSGK